MQSTNLTEPERIVWQVTGQVPRLLIIISGPSGVGKNTIIKNVLANHRLCMERVRTYTTRPARPDELPGDQYHFVSEEEFRQLARAGRLMEADEGMMGRDVYGLGKVYSLPANVFEGIPSDKHLVLAEVDIYGMRLLKERFPQSISIFVTAPPLALLERIRERDDAHNMTAEEIQQRMQTARRQMRAAREFDYVVFNSEDHVDTAIEAVSRIIAAERLRVRQGFDLEAVLPKEAFAVPPLH